MAVRVVRTVPQRMRMPTKTQLRMVMKMVPRGAARVAREETETLRSVPLVRRFAMQCR